ncbi:MAG: GntR family transcriptional regulator [Oscillospiraceae bacterium]|nr:GntR family transcriptional regulator [Oscillospiraceae bacterium]MDE5885720.1 GntR family transcriptional regulator [Oscillospiraceae bacterium]
MFDIDLMSRIPIYEQLYRKVIELILKSVLTEQDKLPSVRSLATQLGVNPNTVAKAYSLLERDGIIYSLAGRGSFIAKPDKMLAQERVLRDFDSAVSHALDIGIPQETLTERIDQIAEEKSDQNLNQKGDLPS